MSKIFKTVSTAMIAVGLVFLFRYIQIQGSSRLEIFQKPSYYTMQNYWFVFVAGIGVLLFSLLGSFFSWFKEFDEKEEILPNAGYASDQEIRTWVTGAGTDVAGTAPDTDGTTAVKTAVLGQGGNMKETEVLPEGRSTELLSSADSSGAGEKTSIISGREQS